MDDPDAMGDDDDAGLGDGDDLGDDPTMGDPSMGGDEQSKTPPPFAAKMPRPSMMHRMMRPESTSPAVQNFMQALQG